MRTTSSSGVGSAATGAEVVGASSAMFWSLAQRARGEQRAAVEEQTVAAPTKKLAVAS